MGKTDKFRSGRTEPPGLSELKADVFFRKTSAVPISRHWALLVLLSFGPFLGEKLLGGSCRADAHWWVGAAGCCVPHVALPQLGGTRGEVMVHRV